MNGRSALGVPWALAKRNLRRYFNNPTGYVFVTLLIFLSAVAAFWQPRFFLDNLANLDQLNEVFPYLLLFFVPALTMSVWSEERKQGTDELLLTLPASDLEIVLGKWAAIAAVYTAAVLLSLSHVLVLVWLGHPDPGLLAGNYLGYWLVGAALIPIGMVASLLTSNVTVAFIVGVALCAAPVALGTAAGWFSEAAGRRVAPFGVFAHFDDFARGTVSLAGLLYFLSLWGFFLCLNVVILGRRHWPSRSAGGPMWLHQTLRIVALAVALVAANIMLGRADLRFDVTSERLHTLSPETRRLIAELPADRPVLIQAFISPDVPQAYVQVRENLLGALREVEALAGPKVTVLVESTAPYSEAARMARERFGIPGRLVADPASLREEPQQTFLGVAFTCGAEEQVIPFFERGLSAEDQIARAIRVVARTSRKRIGVVDTDAKVFGGVDYGTDRPRPSWRVVDELRKQYEIVEITPWDPIKAEVDALLVVLPSTLDQRELDHVGEAMARGVPALLIVDPVPAVDMSLAPSAPMAAALDPYQQMPAVRKKAGDVQKMLREFGVNWPPAQVAWDSYRPHPEMAQMPPEVVFVGPGSGNPDAFNEKHPASAGLQELLMLYPGFLQAVTVPGLRFTSLAQTGRLAGSESFFEFVRPSPSGMTMNLGLAHQPEGQAYVLAADISPEAGGPIAAGPTSAPPPASTRAHLIVIADLDFISDPFFDLRSSGPATASFDNVTFFLNCIDVLARDESFISLRKRRPRHRTLERVEAQTRIFIEQRSREEDQAQKDADAAIDEAKNRMKQIVDRVAARRDLDAQAKDIMARNLEETESRRLAVLQTNINIAKDSRIQAGRERMEGQVRRIQGTIRTVAVLAPPLPVLLLGGIIFIRRHRREREGAAAMRRLRQP